MFCTADRLSLSAAEAFADQAQAFVRAGGHGQGEGLALNAEVAEISFAAHMGDGDAVSGEEVGDVLIAGVAAHGWGRWLGADGVGGKVRHDRSSVREWNQQEVYYFLA